MSDRDSKKRETAYREREVSENTPVSSENPPLSLPRQSAKIVKLVDYMEDPHSQRLEDVAAYWEELRGNRIVPRRIDIDPRAIQHQLEHCFIIEHIAPGLARFRVAGQQIASVLGMDPRGMPASALFNHEARSSFSTSLEQVFGYPAKLRLSMRSGSNIGCGKLNAALMILPLKSDLGDISRALGVLSVQGQLGKAPRRFTIENSRIMRLAGQSDQKQTTSSAAGQLESAMASSNPIDKLRNLRKQLENRPELRVLDFEQHQK